MVSFWQVIKTNLTKKFFTISGRATRTEFCFFHLFYSLIFFFFVIACLSEVAFLAIITGVLTAILLVPSFCIHVRRLHDAGYSGMYMLLPFIPIVWVFFINLLMKKSADDNEWGADPHKIRECKTQDSLLGNSVQEDNVVKTEVNL